MIEKKGGGTIMSGVAGSIVVVKSCTAFPNSVFPIQDAYQLTPAAARQFARELLTNAGMAETYVEDPDTAGAVGRRQNKAPETPGRGRKRGHLTLVQ